MAPFHGPSLVGAVQQLARGTSVTVGRGVPAAELTRDGDGYVITTLVGGAARTFEALVVSLARASG